MEHFTWTKGNPAEKSLKSDNPNLHVVVEKNVKKISELIKSELIIGDTFISASNKRELANDKLNNRNMISQIGQNPFMTSNNYLHDLEVQQNFLIPKNSNYKDAFATE